MSRHRSTLDEASLSGISGRVVCNNEYTDVIDRMRRFLKSLRRNTPRTDFALDRAAASDIRTGYNDGRTVRRLVITLRSPGCFWTNEGGGCTMCGHHAGTTRGVRPSSEETLRQFHGEIERYDLSGIEILSLYNSGSMLNPGEVAHDTLERLFVSLSELPSIRKVVLETRAEYVDPERLTMLRRKLRSDQRITIAIGLESENDIRRELCMNKGASLKQIETAVRSLDGIAEAQLYILLGLPFLTEAEMIDDSVASIRRAGEMGADEIHIEPATLQKHTFADYLARAGLYRLPSLHSLFRVVQSVLPEYRPYVSPFLHMPLPDRIPESCPVCTGRLIDILIERYNSDRSLNSLEHPVCGCERNWLARLDETDSRSLPERVRDALDILETMDLT